MKNKIIFTSSSGRSWAKIERGLYKSSSNQYVERENGKWYLIPRLEAERVGPFSNLSAAFHAAEVN